MNRPHGLVNPRPATDWKAVAAQCETGAIGRVWDAVIAAHLMGWTHVEAECFTPNGQDWCGSIPAHWPTVQRGFQGTDRGVIPLFTSSWMLVPVMHHVFAELAGPVRAERLEAYGEALCDLMARDLGLTLPPLPATEFFWRLSCAAPVERAEAMLIATYGPDWREKLPEPPGTD